MVKIEEIEYSDTEKVYTGFQMRLILVGAAEVRWSEYKRPNEPVFEDLLP